jgi:NADH-quinone oxidoreductase subunit J
MDSWLISPIALYAFLAVGAVGVALSMPRPRVSPQLIGGIISAAAFGGFFLFLARTDSPQPPFFYIFALIAILSGLRVITHPRPVYSALYFIFTILASSVLYLLLQAEFMAFALLIIYAGAILITYLFVIMLATQAPTEDQLEALSEYDAYSREPLVATALGFVLLAVLTGYMSRGVSQIVPRDAADNQQARLADMPRKAIDSLRARGAFEVFDEPALRGLAPMMDTNRGTVVLTLDRAKLDKLEAKLSDPRFAEFFGGVEKGKKEVAKLKGEPSAIDTGGAFAKPSADDAPAPRAEAKSDGRNTTQVRVNLPADASVENVELVGFALVAKHPMALELAGIILLMAMLGAVVLARKQAEMGEDEKAAAAARLGERGAA